MEQVGFGIFGIPLDHRYVSNGLFKSLGIERETYLNLPNGVLLNKGERIVKISRQAINSEEVIKVYIFDYALPANKNTNGFIGTAYVFKGNPTEKLLYTSVKNLHNKTSQFLDQNGKFIDHNFENKDNELINPNSTNLLKGNARKIKPPTNKTIYGVYTEGGPVLNHLMSVVQGFMYNPNFSGLESLYVSDNTDLLLRILGNNQGNLLNIGHILNFENHFNYLNSQLEVKKNEFEELKKSIQDEKSNKDAEIREHIKELIDRESDLDSKIREKNKTCAKLDKDILERRDELNNLDRHKNAAEENKNKINNEIQSLRETKKKLENENQTAFNKLINNKDFERERNNFIENSSLVKELMNEKSNLEEKIGKSEKVTFKEKVLIIGIPLILLIGSYLIGNYFPVFNKKSQPETTINETENPEKSKELAEFKQLPKEYTTKKFINLPEEKQKSHKDSIDDYLDALERDKPGLEPYNFFNRKWNFAELIDVDKFNSDDVLGGLDRITKIKEIYKKHGKDDSVFSKRFGITEIDKAFEENDFPFESDKRNEILNKYISEDRNIYTELGFSEYRFETGFDNLGNLEGKGDEILIYMHFRWMVYKLSGDKTDLKTTTKKEHKVLFTK